MNGSTRIPTNGRPLTETQQLALQQLTQAVDNIRDGVEKFLNELVDSLPDTNNVDELLGKFSQSSREKQFGKLLVNLLSILDQNLLTRDTYANQISKIKTIISGNKFEYFAAQKERSQYFEVLENKVFRSETKSANEEASVKPSFSVNNRRNTPVGANVTQITSGIVRAAPITGNKVTRVASRAEVPISNVTRLSAISSGTGIKAFGQTLELKTTVTDGNCGPDSLQKALSSVSHAAVPSNVKKMRADVANRCENVRLFTVGLYNFIKSLRSGLTTEKYAAHFNNVFNKLQGVFITFDAFKSAMALSDNKNLNDIIKGVDSWDGFQNRLRMYDSETLFTNLKIIQQFFSVNFTNEDTGVFSGVSRAGVNHSNYHNTIIKSGVYLDIQEMKVGLLAYGFSVVSYKVVGKNTIFKAKNDQNQEMYLYLTRYAYGISKKIESNSHWQYLTAR